MTDEKECEFCDIDRRWRAAVLRADSEEQQLERVTCSCRHTWFHDHEVGMPGHKHECLRCACLMFSSRPVEVDLPPKQIRRIAHMVTEP